MNGRGGHAPGERGGDHATLPTVRLGSHHDPDQPAPTRLLLQLRCALDPGRPRAAGGEEGSQEPARIASARRPRTSSQASVSRNSAACRLLPDPATPLPRERTVVNPLRACAAAPHQRPALRDHRRPGRHRGVELPHRRHPAWHPDLLGPQPPGPLGAVPERRRGGGRPPRRRPGRRARRRRWRAQAPRRQRAGRAGPFRCPRHRGVPDRPRCLRQPSVAGDLGEDLVEPGRGLPAQRPRQPARQRLPPAVQLARCTGASATGRATRWRPAPPHTIRQPGTGTTTSRLTAHGPEPRPRTSHPDGSPTPVK
jgi:hypothetical protein